MTTVEGRLIEIANYLPPQQKDDLAALVKCMSGTIVIAAAHFMGEIDPRLAVSFSDFIRAGRKDDA